MLQATIHDNSSVENLQYMAVNAERATDSAIVRVYCLNSICGTCLEAEKKTGWFTKLGQYLLFQRHLAGINSIMPIDSRYINLKQASCK